MRGVFVRVAIGALLVCAMVGALLAPAAGSPEADPEPTWGPQDLWAALSPARGWGFDPGSITNPGPPIVVGPGETVQLQLLSGDAPTPHQWVLDMNGNQLPDVSDIQSPVFSSGTTAVPFSFTAPSTAANLWYFCGIHGWGAQRGEFIVTGNMPPTVSLTNPDGVAQNRWTGGFAKRLTWTMGDDGPPSQLQIWLNYSYNAGANGGAIASPLTLPLGSTSFDWNVPTVDATDMRVLIDVVDGQGARGSDAKLVPIVDSTRPRVDSTNPANGATGVPLGANVATTFSEPMNRTATGNRATVGLQEVAASAWVSLAYAWNPSSTILTVDPVPTLSPATQYRLHVNASARDAGDPGLTMAGPSTVLFTTVTGMPPTIANVAASPPSQTVGGTVEISADVTDDVGVTSVSVDVTLPDSSTRNETMVRGVGDRYAFSGAWTQVGTHAFVIWASDTAGNWASAAGSFAITSVDATNPTVTITSPQDGAVLPGPTVTVTGTASDDVGLQRVEVSVDGTTWVLATGTTSWSASVTLGSGPTTIRARATDTSGNTAIASVTVTVEGMPDVGPDPVLIVAGVVLAVLAVVALFLLLRRRGARRSPPRGPG